MSPDNHPSFLGRRSPKDSGAERRDRAFHCESDAGRREFSKRKSGPPVKKFKMDETDARQAVDLLRRLTGFFR